MIADDLSSDTALDGATGPRVAEPAPPLSHCVNHGTRSVARPQPWAWPVPHDHPSEGNAGANAATRARSDSGRPLVRVVDVDDAVRDALGGLFRSAGLSVVLFGSVDELLLAGRMDAPGCLVLDVRLPGIVELEMLEAAMGRNDAPPAVLMTGHGDISMTVRAMKAGAVDFLGKPFRDQDMLDAVTTAIRGDQARRKAAEASAELCKRLASLSPREKQVMALVAAGLMNKQIAYRVGLSEITVKIHRGNAMRKMGARSLAELVRQAAALGLEPVDGRQKSANEIRW